MTDTSVFELAILAFIVIGIFTAIFKAGRANPENTGKIGKDLHAIRADVDNIDGRVRNLEGNIADMATKGDIDVLSAKIDGNKELAERTFKQIDRIETFLLQKGMGA